MKQFFTKLRQTAIAGFFFLFPLYVVFIVISKAWTSLISVGSKLASMFGVKTVLGVGGATLFSSLLIIAVWLPGQPPTDPLSDGFRLVQGVTRGLNPVGALRVETPGGQVVSMVDFRDPQ